MSVKEIRIPHSFLGQNQFSGKSVLERFEEKYIPEPNSGCWIWLGALSANGRSSFQWGNGRISTAHKWAYIFFRGEIPDGLELDHLCCNPSCVNPHHLEAVPRSVNGKRYWNWIGKNDVRRQVVECKNGHPFNVQNTRIDPQTKHKICRVCDRARHRTYWEKTHGSQRNQIAI